MLLKNDVKLDNSKQDSHFFVISFSRGKQSFFDSDSGV